MLAAVSEVALGAALRMCAISSGFGSATKTYRRTAQVNSNVQITSSSEGDLDVRVLSRILWRRKYLIAVFTCATTALAIAYALVATQVYRAEVVITDVTDRGSGGVGSLANQLGGLASLAGMNLSLGGEASQQAHAVLRSRYLAEEFVRRNGLERELLSKQQDPSKSSLWFAVEAFRNGVLDIHDDKRTGTVTIAIEWTDAAKAASWANGYVALANELLRTRAMDESSKNIAYLRQQVQQTNVLELQNVMYHLIESETKVLMLANGRAEYAFTVVDPAVAAQQRYRPRRRLLATVGLLAGLVLSSLIAFFLERAGFASKS